MFERVASNLGQSVKLPRPLNRAGKPYGKASYSLASFEKNFTTKSLPLGYKWPGFEPNPLLDCDSPICQSPSKCEIKRLTCGHTFHYVCMGNNGCTVCLPNLIKDIKKLSQLWNQRLMKDDGSDDDSDNDDDNNDDDPDDDDSTPLKPGENTKNYDYFDSKLFKDYVVNRTQKMKEFVTKSNSTHNLHEL